MSYFALVELTSFLKNINTYNPLKIAFTEWGKLFQDTVRATSIASVKRLWTAPPDWDPKTEKPHLETGRLESLS